MSGSSPHVPASRFDSSAARDVREYTFNTGVARHRLRGVRGIKSFYVPRSHPGGIDVNVHCLDAGTVESVDVSLFDDTNRDAATAAIAHLARPQDAQA